MLAVCSHRGTQAEVAQSIELLHQAVGNMFLTRFYAGDAWLDRLRSVAATEFLKQNWAKYMIFIDDDIIFMPEHVMAIYDDMEKGYDLIGGLYPTRSGTQLASYGLNDMGGIPIDGQIQEIKWLATGFMGFSRKLLERMVDELKLPLLHKNQWCECYPFFVFCQHETDRGNPMLFSEDWEFCEKAKRIGVKTYADTRCMVGHKGEKVFSLSDVVSHNRYLEAKENRLKGILNTDNADKALKAATKVLHGLGVPCWIDSGTLLSTVRDGDFNKYDHDIDVRLFRDDLPDELMPVLVSDLYKEGYKTIQQNTGDRKQILALWENDVMLDLKFVERNEDWVWYHVWDKVPGSSIFEKSDVVTHVFPSRFYKEFETIDLRGIQYLAPKPIEEYLTYHYGDEWRTFKAKPEDVDMTDFLWDAQKMPPCVKTLDQLKELTARPLVGAPSGE
uniref:Uncharacterized protein n=1 Tax=viral metagenome TaxID=1070528 RepID=A0A6M3JZC9_9ZZZZ